MTGRNTILERIRKNKPELKPLPERFVAQNTTQTNEQLISLFKESLKKVGAEVQEFANKDKIRDWIANNFQNAIDLLNPEEIEKNTKIFSNEELGKTEFVVIEAQFGVAENGAVWVDDTNFPNRLLPFVTQQLILILEKGTIVANMHEAYQKIEIEDIGFGVFISGPSKTADIEQSLVYGAHGAKTLRVILH